MDLIDNGDKLVFSLHEFVMKMTKISETKQEEKRERENGQIISKISSDKSAFDACCRSLLVIRAIYFACAFVDRPNEMK